MRHAVLLPALAVWGLVLALPIGPAGAMAAMLVATVVALGVVSWSRHRLRPGGLAGATGEYQAQHWQRAAAALFAIANMRSLQSRADLLVLGLLADPAAVGVYAMAARTADLVAFSLVAINAIFVPNVAGLHARGDRAGLQSLVTMTAWWSALSALAVALPLFVLAGFVLSLFGDAFTSGSFVLRVLLVGQFVNAAAGSVGAVLTMTGHERQAAVTMGIAALAQVGLSVALVPLFGAAGAAVANATSMIAWNLAMGVLVWKQLEIVPSVLARR